MTLVLLVGGLLAGLWIVQYGDYSVEYPARFTAPDRVGALVRVKDGRPDQAERALVADTGSVTVLYRDTRHRDRRAFLVGRAERVLSPERAVRNAAGVLSDRYAVDPGRLGGVVECGASGDSVTVCVWADHGSVGVVRFTGWSPIDAAQLVGEVRAATVVRG